ncbi:C40 family peptidase [Bacillus sp. T33-2]|uniref:C40 family peptidase n=1 Tax=Bacillus sp. T33-2 TaxID=2054168 RepID=UPI000C767FD3|nr:peptidoglycan endopeptidase [Bacillus sp. T33-2]PLR95866.1 peptidoglycan endopeptidase [Bacillus sp. T33-2]
MKKHAATVATAVFLSSAFASVASADTYTVKKGDTLSHIARTYKTNVTELKRQNNLPSDLIYVNQTLTVPGPGGNQPQQPAPSASVPVSTAGYTVVKGDTLGKIANRHNISLANLMAWNGLTNHLIYPGQRLTVSQSASAPAPAVSAPAPTPAPAPAGNIEYTIKPGDTLGAIARQHGVTVQQLKSWNGLSSDLIFAGQKLNIQSAAAPAPVQNQPAVQQPAPNGEASAIISTAQSLLGTPYAWGGSAPGGFDCSGLIYYVYNQSGKKIGRYSSEGYYNRSYYVNQPQPGDLVFFENTYKKGISHMGIYLGGNQFIHAGSDSVMISSLNSSYWQQHFDGFKRFY